MRNGQRGSMGGSHRAAFEQWRVIRNRFWSKQSGVDTTLSVAASDSGQQIVPLSC